MGKATVIIRTYNEARHLPELLESIRTQIVSNVELEVLVVDSGSTDDTLDIARGFHCRIEHIRKEDFSFGRSLNTGCAAATGDALVFISGHCIPASDMWLDRLLEPLAEGRAALAYGRQMGNGLSRFSECRIFEKYYPKDSRVPQQEGFFCNNANAALLRDVWQANPFDESLAGLEDMHLAKQLVGKNMAVAYVAEAAVYHLHDETWEEIKNRFERESIALQYIMPEIHVSFEDFLRYASSSILLDSRAAMQQKELFRRLGEIVMYRIAQYWGSYRGNHYHRIMSRQRKERYFYPR